ncbi:MAG: hypothetical protein OWS74_06235, partial [Firmicutes bacterium]|nr:hypothetical protein [Bacillota bacterium]
MARFEEWLAEHHIHPEAWDILAIVRQDNAVTIQISVQKEEDRLWQDQLAAELASSWHVPVAIQGYTWPQDPAQHLKEIWRVTQARFYPMIGDHAVVYQDGALSCYFPNQMAQQLFAEWGGPARLHRLWPD